MSYFDENARPDESGSTEEQASSPEAVTPEETAPAEETTPAEETATAEETAPTDETAPTEETAPVEESTARQEETVSYGQGQYSAPYASPDRAQTGGFADTYMAYAAHEERARRVRNGMLAGLLALALLVVTLFGGVMIGRLSPNGTPGGMTTSGSPSGNDRPTVDRGNLTLNVVEREANLTDGTVPSVVAAVKSSVVEIRTETTVNSPYYGEYVQSGAGSGVLITDDGKILTCAHVIEGGQTIRVVTSDGSSYVAEVLGTDSWSDLALLQIDATGLPYAKMAIAPAGSEDDYSYMAVGESVIAIGNPLGELGGSVTVGVISALGRSVTVEGVPMTLMQIDASVNPGNSGGGLFNMDGYLIGIVNAKSTGESIEGIGFAIPSVDALDIVGQLARYGYVSGRPYLGLFLSSSLQIQSYEYNDDLPEGKRIQSGDILYSVDGKKISSSSELRTVLASKKVGDTVVIQVVRYISNGYDYMKVDFTLPVHEYVPTVSASEGTLG